MASSFAQLGEAISAAVADQPRRRVRHDVRDGVTVVVFSAAASTGLALLLLLVAGLAG